MMNARANTPATGPYQAALRRAPSPELRLGFGFSADLDLFSGSIQALRADLEVDARLVDRLQRIFQREVAVLQDLQLLVELLERLLVRQVLAHDSTSSTRAPSLPEPRRIRIRRSTAVPAAERTTAPDSASCVML